MHDGYDPKNKNVKKEIKRVYYNSSLANSESEFPFHSGPSTTGELKNLRVNLALYKEKLQNQFQKCREYIKEISQSVASTSSSSGILQEIVLENIGKSSKKNLLKYMHEMGLKLKEAHVDNETIIVVDLSAINDNQQAVDNFLSFIKEVKENKCKMQCRKSKQVSDINLNYYENKKPKIENDSEKSIYSHKDIKLVSIAKLKNSNETNISKINHTNDRTVTSAHYFEDGQSFCLNESYIDVKSSKQSTRNKEHEEFIKAQDSKKYKNKTNSNLQNLFRSEVPSKVAVFSKNGNKTNKKQKETKKKKSRINRLLNILKMLFFIKEKTDKIDKGLPERPVFSVLAAYTTMNEDSVGRISVSNSENNSKNNVLKQPQKTSKTQISKIGSKSKLKVHKNKKIAFNPSIIVMEGSEEEEQDGSDRKLTVSVIDEPPARIWGHEISPESNKELELLVKKQRDSLDLDINGARRTSLNIRNIEINKILDEQVAIKEMIENIQNTLKRCEIESVSEPYSNKKSISEPYHRHSHVSSNPWSDQATISSDGKCNRSNDSMTNIPSSSCWCPELCDKIKSLCQCFSSKSNLETAVHCELQDQRREIIRLNKLLHQHILKK